MSLIEYLLSVNEYFLCLLSILLESLKPGFHIVVSVVSVVSVVRKKFIGQI